jgi:hypothetical protein
MQAEGQTDFSFSHQRFIHLNWAGYPTKLVRENKRLSLDSNLAESGWSNHHVNR